MPTHTPLKGLAERCLRQGPQWGFPTSLCALTLCGGARPKPGSGLALLQSSPSRQGTKGLSPSRWPRLPGNVEGPAGKKEERNDRKTGACQDTPRDPSTYLRLYHQDTPWELSGCDTVETFPTGEWQWQTGQTEPPGAWSPSPMDPSGFSTAGVPSAWHLMDPREGEFEARTSHLKSVSNLSVFPG